MICGGTVAYLMTSVVGGWRLFYGLTAGIGGVYLARWLWWRVSAWSEIAAWTSSALTYLILQWRWPELGFGWHLVITAFASTLCWSIVTLLTPPTETGKLVAFYERVRPASPWWGPIAALSGLATRRHLSSDVVSCLAGVAFVFAALFGLGKLLLFGWTAGLPYLAVALASGWVVKRSVARV